MTIWLKDKCPVCGKEYEYTEAYKPKTCSNFDCVYKYLHHTELYTKRFLPETGGD